MGISSPPSRRWCGTDRARGIYVLKVTSMKNFINGEGKVKFTYTDEAGAPQSAAAVYDASSKTYKADLSALKIKGKTQVEFILESPAAGVEIKDQYVIGNTVTIASTTNGTVNKMSGASGSTAFGKAIPWIRHRRYPVLPLPLRERLPQRRDRGSPTRRECWYPPPRRALPRYTATRRPMCPSARIRRATGT